MDTEKSKEITLSDYGFFIFSANTIEDFLKENKIRGKKVLNKFIDNHELYLKSIEKGVWLPISNINADKYTLFLGIYPNKEWEKINSWHEFNINIGEDDSMWIGSLSSLNLWDYKQFYIQEDVISYKTWNGENLNKFIRFHVKKGLYHLTLTQLRNNSNKKIAYLLDLVTIDSFEKIKDPRECNFKEG